MKKVIFLLFFLSPFILFSQKNFYLQPHGNQSGTLWRDSRIVLYGYSGHFDSFI